MTNELLAKIDTLISMSKSTSNYDTLKAELTEIQEETESKKREIEDLKASMTSEKYMKASDRIIDENIKVSLELKIQKLESNCKKTEKELKKLLKDEDSAHKTVQKWKSNVAKTTNLLNALNTKLASLNEDDNETIEYYQNLITENEKKLDVAKINVTESSEEYQKTSRELTSKTQEVETLKTQIKDEKEKLANTVKSLSSADAYIDLEKKAEDASRIEELKNRVTSLQNREKEILSDPVYIGNEAKELLIEDDRTGCLAKIKELIKIIKTLPYMDIANSSDIEKILKEAEERAILERDEFASFIENKKYDGTDIKIVEEREKYLESKKEEIQRELDSLEKKVKRIDTTAIREINSLLSAAIIVEENLKKELKEYDHVLNEEKENSTPKKKAVLTAAYKKKEEELSTVAEIISSYESEMEELIMESKQLEEVEIQNLKQKKKNIENLLKDIAKKTLVSSKATDVLALENDKIHLKELNDALKDIEDRRKYKETPSEIYDEIEMSLSSLLEEETKIEETQTIEEDPNSYRIIEDIEPMENENIIEDVSPEIEEVKEMKESVNEVVDLPWEQEPQKETQNEPEPVISPLFEEFTNPLETIEPVSVEEFMNPTESHMENNTPIEESVLDIPVSERLRVIDVEDLNNEGNIEETQEKVEPEVLDDDILIGDFKDDDYIDFDSIIGGSSE